MTTNALRHVGFIMDGNRRWARRNGMPELMRGHEAGADKFFEACDWCGEFAIPYVSTYAFSTENWARSGEEVAALFRLFEKFFREKIPACVDKGYRIRIVGDFERLAPPMRDMIETIEADTANGSALTVIIAISYGGRDEMLRAVRKLHFDRNSGIAAGADITEALFESYLDLHGVPDIDMVVRTGGCRRLSNFFPWQTAYSELYFTKTLWPDFSKSEFSGMIDEYRSVVINKGK